MCDHFRVWFWVNVSVKCQARKIGCACVSACMFMLPQVATPVLWVDTGGANNSLCPQSLIIALQVRHRTIVDTNCALTLNRQQCDPDGVQRFCGHFGEKKKIPKGVNSVEIEPLYVIEKKAF